MPHLLTRILSSSTALPTMPMSMRPSPSLTLSMSMSKSTHHAHALPVDLHVDLC